MKKIALKQKKVKKFGLWLMYAAILLVCVGAYDVYSVSRTNTLSASFLDSQSDNVKANFNLKVADTDKKRQQGLMFVKELKPDDGMIFVYPRDTELIFWMKNTFIPLDIVFLDKNYIVVGIIENMEPMGGRTDLLDDELPRYTIKRKSRYAVELPSAAVKKYNINVGDKLFLGGE